MTTGMTFRPDTFTKWILGIAASLVVAAAISVARNAAETEKNIALIETHLDFLKATVGEIKTAQQSQEKEIKAIQERLQKVESKLENQRP